MHRTIYKYLPLERLSYLDDELIRLTQPGDLNDPFECLPAPPTVGEIEKILELALKSRVDAINASKASKATRIELRDRETRRMKTVVTNLKKNMPGNFREKFLIDVDENINSQIGIISFSRRWNSTLMWSHYSNCHKGFCVGFNASDPFFMKYSQLADTQMIFLPVNYSDERLKVPTEKGRMINPMVMLTKSLDWSYEEEERLLAQYHLHEKKISASPYDIYLMKLKHSLINEIIVGAKIPKAQIKQIARFCKDQKIPLYQSRVSDTVFSMERELIDLVMIA